MTPRSLFLPGDRPWLHFLLLGLTLVTTTTTFRYSFVGAPSWREGWGESLTFSLALILILGSHEMGHYLYARWHRVDSSLPYFIPLPFLGVGTLGAVIRMRSRIPTRDALVDIGAAGPLAGFIVAIPVICYGLVHSTVVDVPPSAHVGFLGDGSLIALGGELWRAFRYFAFGEALPTEPVPSQFFFLFGDNLLLRGLEWLMLGPLPEGKDVSIHPLVMAGWFGLLVTMLNLMPIGQLDGGHLAFALLGDRARAVGKIAALTMLVLCLFFSAGWLLWLIITAKVIGFRHPEVVEAEAPLTGRRKLVIAACALVLVLCAMPIPISVVSVP